MSMTSRVLNFGAGPAVLPTPVLETIQRELMALPDVGMSVLEISHRSAPFDHMLQEAEADLRALADIPDEYRVLFLQGGASLQFSMVPMNLSVPGRSAEYLVTGAWSQKAVREAEKVGAVHVAASTEADQFARIPRPAEIDVSPDAAYVHLTSNNTIFGTQWRDVPDVGDVPLVSDMSSDVFSRPIDVARHALIYAGAQKNLGPAGVTLVVIREDLLARSATTLPSMLSYALLAEHGSRYNTPPVFGVYVLGLVVKWLRERGGLQGVGRESERKAKTLYAEIDRTEFYRGTAEPDSRSLMNVTFRLPTAELDAQFVRAAAAAGLAGVKGHRAVGGQRASLYNAMPAAGVDTLVSFMTEFERRYG